jgi:hypothetical protein
MTRGDINKRQPDDDGLGSGLAADLSDATSTCSNGRWLLLPLCVTDGGLLPRCLDLAGGLGSGLIIFLFLKIDFRCLSVTTDTKKEIIFHIGEMVYSTNICNLLPTDTKKILFFSTVNQTSPLKTQLRRGAAWVLTF